MTPALLLAVLLGASPQAPVVAVRGFNAVGTDAVTAGLLTQRFAAGLARSGIQVVSLAELARFAPEERRQGLLRCGENSEPCRQALRESGVQALLYGTVSFMDFQWRFAATALDVRDGSTVASLSEVSQSRSGIEQRLDISSGRFGEQIAINVSRPVQDRALRDVGRNVISIAPLALGLGAIYLEYERVLTDRFSLTFAPGVENLYPGVIANPFASATAVRLDASLRFYPQGSAPQGCWMSVGANTELQPGTPRYGGAALVGCSVALGEHLLGTAAVGAGVDNTATWGLDGRFHLGLPF